jgi:hypothetical protein
MKKRLKYVAALFLLTFIGFLLIKAKEGKSPGEIYPEVTQAPVLQLTWSGNLNPEDAIRYTPYGIWENVLEYNEGTAYEPANEMQFYMKTDVSDYLAVAPGIVNRSQTFENSVGLVSIQYGENYVITYHHIIPNKNIKTGMKIETGDIIGKMEKRINPNHGEETWWEIQLTIKRSGLYRTLPPYDYFDKESQELLDKIAENHKETGPGEAVEKPYWTITEGCSWIKYTGVPEWWDSNRFGGLFQKESEKEFINNLDPSWEVADDKGNLIGPTDVCGY